MVRSKNYHYHFGKMVINGNKVNNYNTLKRDSEGKPLFGSTGLLDEASKR